MYVPPTSPAVDYKEALEIKVVLILWTSITFDNLLTHLMFVNLLWWLLGRRKSQRRIRREGGRGEMNLMKATLSMKSQERTDLRYCMVVCVCLLDKDCMFGFQVRVLCWVANRVPIHHITLYLSLVPHLPSFLSLAIQWQQCRNDPCIGRAPKEGYILLREHVFYWNFRFALHTRAVKVAKQYDVINKTDE